MIENNAPDENVNWFLKVLDWVVTICIPVILVLVTIRLLLNPWFLDFEYRTPGFPEDRYGFTQAERLYWSKITLEYLVNDAGIDYLADLRFTEGQLVPEPSCSYMNDCTLLYNDRELSHMVDVKNAVVIANRVMWIAIGIVALIGVFAWRGRRLKNYRLAVARGGWLTLLLTVSIILFVLMAFSVIFVWFHEIFFEPGTWTFFYSDTLIRLFPERLWRDTFLIVAGLPALLGAAMGYFLGKRTVKIRR